MLIFPKSMNRPTHEFLLKLRFELEMVLSGGGEPSGYIGIVPVTVSSNPSVDSVGGWGTRSSPNMAEQFK